MRDYYTAVVGLLTYRYFWHISGHIGFDFSLCPLRVRKITEPSLGARQRPKSEKTAKSAASTGITWGPLNPSMRGRSVLIRNAFDARSVLCRKTHLKLLA